MKLWIRKIAVIFIAAMTLGTYIPPTLLNTEAEDNKGAVSSKSDITEDVRTPVTIKDEQPRLTLEHAEVVSDEQYIDLLTEKAREQAITKLGPKIIQQVEDDFTETILPTIEEVLKSVLAEGGQDSLPYYGITERPTSGFGEKIFHVYDYRTKKDIARFHVRRDNRPQEGYWFNFHYHLSKDNFEEHHEIGEIYWDKNVPPKWMA